MAGDEIKTFEVVFDCNARAVGKMRCEMDVRLTHPEQIGWEFASDEYGFHGGDGSAPLPISYFVAGLTSCLMTQIRAFSKRMRIPINDVKIYCRCAWTAEMEGRNPYVSSPKSIDMDIDIDSDESEADIRRLIEAAKKGCFIEQMLSVPNEIGHRLKVGGDWVEI